MTAKPPIPPEHVDNWVCEAVRKLFGDQPCSEVGGHLYRRVLVFLHADMWYRIEACSLRGPIAKVFA